MADPAEDDREPEPPVISGPTFQDGTPAPVQDILSDCRESIGSFGVPAQEYWDLMPPGFGVAPYSALGAARTPLLSADHDHMDGALAPTPPDPTAFTGELVAVASTCHNLADAPVTRLLVFLMVEPPADLTNEAAAFGHLLLFAYFTDSEAHAELLDAWGFGSVLRLGPIDIQSSDDVALRTTQTTGSVGATTARLETQVAGEPAEMAGSAARFFAMDANGTISGIADASFGSFDAAVGDATLAGSKDAGPWQQDADLVGLGLQIQGHSNTWDHVAPSPQGGVPHHDDAVSE